MTEEKRTITNNEKENAMIKLQEYIRICPQIIQPGIGLEVFVEDLNRAAAKYVEYTYVEQRYT